MKKITLAVLLAIITSAALNAYNPPVYGDSYLELSSAKTLTGGTSVSGGPVFNGSPDSIITNPAISAREQRVVLNVGYTALFSMNDANAKKFGSAFQTSFLVPFKIFVLTGYMNGTFVPFEELNLKNSLNFKAAVAKPITEKFDLGLGFSSGFCWGAGKDAMIAGDIGGVYTIGDLGFMKDFRIGVSVLNLGKTFSKTAVAGIYEGDGFYPNIVTLKAGVAASLFRNEIFDIAYAFDLSLPSCLNLIADASLQFSLKDMIVLSVSEKMNIREMAAGKVYMIPAIGLNFKFSFDFGSSNYMKKNGWEQSEFNVYSAYKNINTTVTAASLGLDFMLGMKDTTPPVIELWLGDDDE